MDSCVRIIRYGHVRCAVQVCGLCVQCCCWYGAVCVCVFVCVCCVVAGPVRARGVRTHCTPQPYTRTVYCAVLRKHDFVSNYFCQEKTVLLASQGVQCRCAVVAWHIEPIICTHFVTFWSLFVLFVLIAQMYRYTATCPMHHFKPSHQCILLENRKLI